MAVAMLFVTLSASLAHAAPDGYSINSDSPGANADSLYRINLANGNHQRIGAVTSVGQPRIDVEGLAMAPDGTLYGVDDDATTLFPINTTNGTVVSAEEVFIDGVPSSGGNDFGLTFACDGNLYMTSVTTQTLYRVQLDGDTTPVGPVGNLGANISAIAAYGNPVQLYGLSNDIDNDGLPNARTLFSINPNTGAATEIGPLGGAALMYSQAGLSFDESGVLWALTDRRDDVGFSLPSQILQLNTNTGQATAIANTAESGFESLAISAPRGCATGGGETARFTVDKRFMDRNDIDGATFTLSCNTGIPLQQSITVTPVQGAFGDFEVQFVVGDFASGELDCELREEPLSGYTPTYSCDGMSDCSAGNNSPLDPFFRGPCAFTDVEAGDENQCFIRNYVDAVDIDVTKIWMDDHEEFQGPTNAEMAWACVNARSSGNDLSLGTEQGTIDFFESEETQSIPVFPNFDPERPTVCTVTEQFPGFDSDIESDGSDCVGLVVSPGNGSACTIINTRIYEGIPTLGQYGKLLMALMLLGVGLVATRRIL